MHLKRAAGRLAGWFKSALAGLKRALAAWPAKLKQQCLQAFFLAGGRVLNGYAWLKKVLAAKKRLVIGILAGALFLGLGFTAVLTYLQIRNPEWILIGGDHPRFGPDVNVGEQFPRHVVNIALLGFDRDQFRAEYAYLFLSDVILVASIDFQKDTVKVVRVPRDTYVRVYGTGVKDKINHAYYHGYHYGKGPDRDADGLRFVLETVSYLLGDIPIHYYVSIDMDGMVQFIDAMGGVHFEVKERIYDYDGNILFWEGPQQMDGLAFLKYVRHRDGSTGQDMGRIERQKDLLVATFEYYKSSNRFQAIPDTYRFYKNYVETNLSYKQIAALALYAAEFNATGDNVQFYTLDGTNQTKDGIWYWVLNQAERVRVIKAAFGLNVAPWPVEVLRDTPPPPLKEFAYTLETLEDGRPAVELSWEPGDDKKVTYSLYRLAGDDDAEEEVLLTEEPLAEPGYVDTGVSFGKSYRYRLIVRHYRATGEPELLAVEIPVPAPRELTGKVVNLGAVELRWQSSGSAFKYQISRMADGENAYTILQPEWGQTLYRDSALPETGKTYTYRVIAVNDEGVMSEPAFCSVAVP